LTQSLVAIVADKHSEQALRGILSRPMSIGIRSVPSEIIVHPNRDPGCFNTAAALLSASGLHSHALVVFDHAWEGAPFLTAAEMERDVERRLLSRWGDRCRCVVIDPEVEAWVWSGSPHVPVALGWTEAVPTMRDWLAQRGLWPANLPKPPDPKRAFEAVLRHIRQPRSSAIFARLGRKVSFVGCQDRSFNRLLQTLRAWFAMPGETSRC